MKVIKSLKSIAISLKKLTKNIIFHFSHVKYLNYLLLVANLFLITSLHAKGSDTTQNAKISIQAVRLTEPIIIDGILSESLWQNDYEFSNFVQRDPIENGNPTEKTVIRVAHDDDAIYIGARMYDSKPDSIIARLARRDISTVSDKFTFYVDPYNDKRGGYFFSLNAAGTMYDGTLYNDEGSDYSWDGIWEGKVIIDKNGWTAEMRIPFSQLRFLSYDKNIWGINFKREIARKVESDYIVFTPKNSSGFVSRFVDLIGIEKIPSPSRVEFIPYITSREELLKHSDGDPFNNGSKYTPGFGGDIKFGISNNLTLNATINPDFGQVEVDPAVVNLSDVETYYDEKRPFFIEGMNVFSFGRGGANNSWSFNWGNPSYFYSRRIGHAPQGSISNADFINKPSGVHILGAAKLTGKIGENWNFGTIQTITKREFAEIEKSDQRSSIEIEPSTYYGIARALNESENKTSGIGFISTLTMRNFDDIRLVNEFIKNSLGFGMDGWRFLDANKEWVLTGWVGGSRIEGNNSRVLSIQKNSIHYFQRPDAVNISVDSNATSITGFAGRINLNKQKGNTFLNAAFGIIDPKYDVNDMGMMWRSNIINGHLVMGYKWTETNDITRSANVNLAFHKSIDFDYNAISSGIFLNGSIQFINYYSFSFNMAYNPESVSSNATRGGPLMKYPWGWYANLTINSDSRNSLTYYVGINRQVYLPSIDNSLFAIVSWNPSPNLSLSINPVYEKYDEDAQWVGSFNDPFASKTYGKRYVFASMSQKTFSASIRLNWTFTPQLSLQLFVQPFISSGHYFGFKELAKAKSYEFNVFGSGNSTFDPKNYIADPDGSGPAQPIAIGNPDFTYKSLRGNAVLRWEFTPGSTLFFVWTQDRDDSEELGDFSFSNSVSRLFDMKPDNIFMVKISYWFNM